MGLVHSTAIVDPGATIGNNVEIGAFSIIGSDVTIGDDCWIGPHVVIKGSTTIGRQNKIYQFASVGEDPQDQKYAGEPTRLEIGDRNVIRESATLNRGTANGGGVTRVGSDCLLMAYVHLAHDCQLGDGVIFANNASLAGHVTVGDQAILGGFTTVHQFCAIGAHAFIGVGTVVLKDIPPYLIVSGYPATPHGINREGLKRRGFTPEDISQLRKAYRVLYRSGLSLADAKAELDRMAGDNSAVKLMADFIKGSKRSIVR